MINETLTFDVKSIEQSNDYKEKRLKKIESLYHDASKNRLEFWNSQANHLHWQKPWKQTLEWNRPYSKWFVEGKLNASENCLDVHLKRNKIKQPLYGNLKMAKFKNTHTKHLQIKSINYPMH